MTRVQYGKLKAGDKVFIYGVVATVVSIDGGIYAARSKAFDDGHGHCTVTFAWNEGEPVDNGVCEEWK